MKEGMQTTPPERNLMMDENLHVFEKAGLGKATNAEVLG